MSSKKSFLKKIFSFYVKHVKDKKLELLLKILPVIFGAIIPLWFFGIGLEFIDAVVETDYTMFKDYSQIALTAFGFTLIGGIFEKKNGHTEIEKQLFNSSLLFLITSISFLFMYALSSALPRSMEPIPTTMVVIASFFAMLIGFYGFIAGFLSLFKILVKYRIDIENE